MRKSSLFFHDSVNGIFHLNPLQSKPPSGSSLDVGSLLVQNSLCCAGGKHDFITSYVEEAGGGRGGISHNFVNAEVKDKISFG